MRILVTGARGKVGSATVAALADAGHDVSATDLSRPRFEADAGGVPYRQGDLTDAGDAFALVRGHDAVVHTAAIPDPMHNPPHVVFANNLMATFNVIEAAVRFGVPRVVNLSSETVPGFFFPERPFLPDYVPVDEQHPIRPQDPYATAKHFGEQLMDGAARRSDLTGISIRPSWVQWEGNIEDNLGPWLREPVASEGFWAYIDVYDLADAIRLAAEAATPAHEVALHRLARHRLARDARGAERALPRRRGAGDPAIGRGAPERDLDRQGAGADRLRPAALVARLPRGRRPAAPRRPRTARAGRDRRAARAPDDRRYRPAGWRLTKPAPLRGSSRQRGPSSPRPEVSKRRPAIVM